MFRKRPDDIAQKITGPFSTKKTHTSPIGAPADITPGQQLSKLGDSKFIKGEEPAELMPPPVPNGADLDGDGIVGVSDLLQLIKNWGYVEPGNPADLNNDGIVDVADLLLLIAQWGPVPVPPGPEGPEWELNNPEQFRGITHPY